MIRAIFSGLLLVFMSYGNVVANQYAFQQLTTKDGLAFNNVDHIYQDKDGILYFCTNNGLSTFDGTEFKTYNSDRFSELSNKIFDIQLIGKNKILIGTMDKGIFILDKVTEKISKVNLELKGSSINPSVSVFHTDKNGFIWIGCFTGEIYLVKLEDLISPDISEKIIKCDEITCDGASSIHSFFEYKEQIYIGTNTDIIFSIRRFENNYFIEKSSSIAQINHIYCYSNRGDSLLLGTDKGLFYFFDNKADCTNELIKKNLKESQIRSIIKHENNSYWIGTQNNGLYNLEYGKKEIRLKHFKYNPVKKNSINSNYIISLFIDTNENLWIGTWFGGANMLNLKNKPYNYIYDSKNENDIHSNILWSINKGKQGQYWIGSHGNGLCSYSINDANFYSVIKNENIQSIKSLYNDTISKRLFIGTWGNGIRVLDNKTLTRDLNLENQFTELKDERIYSIANDNKGTLWIGGFYNGLYSYSYSTGKLTKQSLVNFEMGKEQNPDVRFVLPERGDSSMWIGSHLYGLYKVKIKEPGVILENRYFSHFSNTDEKININSLYQAKNGTIWILTGNGLGVIDDKEDTPKKISILNGINCKFMTEDNSGKLWIATFVGLFRLNTQTNKLTTIFGNTSLNNIIYDKTSNSLLACSDNGLLKINLDTVESKAGYPTIFLSSLRIFDKEVAPFEKIKNHVVLEKNINYYDKISLPYFCNSFSVDIRAINPGISNKSIISYKLTGIEQGWNNRVGTSALATFTNLSSGKYELLVKVASSNQNWNPEMRKVVFIIQKAWWFSNIAIFGYFIIIVIILVIILKEIRERVRVKQKLKMEMIEHKRDHDFYEQKLAIFTNISHDIRTPLTLIKGPVEDLINDDTININQKNKLLRIYKNSELLLKLITQILDFRKIDTQNITLELKQINISNLFQNIFNQFKEQADKKHIDFEIELPEDDVFLIADPEKLESILYNLLSNALKFTPLYGNVFVEVIRREKKITLLVKDTGIGIPNKEIHSIFKRFFQFKGLNKNQGTGIGLALVKKYVEMHDAEIHVNSVEKRGTEFIIHFPVKQNSGNYELYPNVEQNTALSFQHLENNSDLSENKNKQQILVVDDNSDMRQYIEELLFDDYDVIQASSGEEGLKIAKRKNPELVICDIMMDGIDGIEVCKQLKSNLNTSHIPIILLTAKNSLESRIAGFEGGAEAYIEKPFNSQLLLTRIKKTIEQRQTLKKKLSIIDLPASKISPTSVDEKFMQNIIEIIDKHIMEPEFSVQGLVDVLQISQDQLYRKVKSLSGLSINHFIRSLRLKKSAQLLKTEKFTVSEIVYQVGFNSASYFTKCFKSEFGMLPSEYIEEFKSMQKK